MDKLEQAVPLVNSLKAERPYSEPGLLLGTSAFTANGWAGAFYPPGMKPQDFLSYYAKQFKTVESMLSGVSELHTCERTGCRGICKNAGSVTLIVM